MTEIKRAAEQLALAQERMVKAEKMASLGQLVAGIAHEINNPCGYVLSNLDTLQQYQKSLDEYWQAVREAGHLAGERFRDLEARLNVSAILEDLPGLMAESFEGAQRMARIVKDLRMFAHPVGESWEFRDIHLALKSALNIVSSEFNDRVQVMIQTGELPPVRMKEQQIVQVFINLLTNAAQAIHGPGTVMIRTFVLGGSVCIEITDSGEGIPEEALPRLFEPFYTTKEVGKGTGLGLSVVHGIIERHKGTIAVRSREGEGSTFTIELPVDGGG